MADKFKGTAGFAPVSQSDKVGFMGNSPGSGITPHGQSFESYETQHFKEWQVAQARAVRSRGESEDLDKEKKYIDNMIRSVLRGYLCYREVDEYSDCLIRKKIVHPDDLHRAEVDMRRAEVFCKDEVGKYQACMGKKVNHETVVEAATGHTSCEDLKVGLQICLEKHMDPDLQERHCLRKYSELLRCGLNHMYDDYWKRISGFGTTEEAHLYEIAKDTTKQQAVAKLKERYGS